MKKQALQHFSIRVYALITNQTNEILVGEEFHFNRFMRKFPGGGLEFGEGTLDCLQREAQEELGQELAITEHFYTSDFFQAIDLKPGYQLLSVFYLAQLTQAPDFTLNHSPYQHTLSKNGSVAFRWIPISEMHTGLMTFNTDKAALALLLKKLEKEQKAS